MRECRAQSLLLTGRGLAMLQDPLNHAEQMVTLLVGGVSSTTVEEDHSHESACRLAGGGGGT